MVDLPATLNTAFGQALFPAFRLPARPSNGGEWSSFKKSIKWLNPIESPFGVCYIHPRVFRNEDGKFEKVRSRPWSLHRQDLDRCWADRVPISPPKKKVLVVKSNFVSYIPIFPHVWGFYNIYIYICMCIYIYMLLYIYIYICIYIYVYMWLYNYIYIYYIIYILSYIYILYIIIYTYIIYYHIYIYWMCSSCSHWHLIGAWHELHPAWSSG